MKTYTIEIKEELSRCVDVKANSIDDAKAIIQEQYYNENIILDSDDFVSTEFIEYKK
ncbi:MAG TPA: DpnD/PcfM family protein [Gelidibacter sp.]|uniref:DpnD/PcfM family protein n=1 Tax=Gelidibacter sp. TaxID=2018083 RepID=UPI002CBA9DE4|nr:DpnD/PcfM family protein [Gelidibacter sp.]HXK00189.1 DpnD/PcfM family protein [Gelidibacter sp.]